MESDSGIFISYRRAGGAGFVQLFKQTFEEQGHDVFLDVVEMGLGPFDKQLLDQIERRNYFLLICSVGCLDRCRDDGDWLRIEIAHALRTNRTIVPIFLEGFQWPNSAELPEEIRNLPLHHGFEYSDRTWDSTRSKLVSLFKRERTPAESPAWRFIKIFLPQIRKLGEIPAADRGPSNVPNQLLRDGAANFLDCARPNEAREVFASIAQSPSKFARDVDAAIADQTPEVQSLVRSYFAQLPGTLQQSLRRTDDRTGRTVPSDLPLSTSDELMRHMPIGLPRFKPGDCPVPSTDLVLVRFIGKGGYGEVWEARHQDRPQAKHVALKFCMDEGAARSLKKEVELLGRIQDVVERHPHIVPLLNTHLRCSPPCLEYELVTGGDLANLMDELSSKPLTPKVVGQIIMQIADPVALAHSQGIVHRDLKPQNVLVVRYSQAKADFKITDFGIGGIIRTEQLKQLQSEGTDGRTLSRGTYSPLYASPQQMGGASACPQDDVFALGVIWFQMLVNDLSRGAPSGRGWKSELTAKGLSSEMLVLLEECIDSDVNERIRDAGELHRRLKDCLTPVGKLTEDPPKPSPATPPKTISPQQPSSIIHLPWAKTLEPYPDPNVVASAFIEPIRATGLPWRVVANSTGIEMLLVPPGEFQMGRSTGDPDAREEEEPSHLVRISKPFYLGRVPVTQAQWIRVMSDNPSRHSGPENPVECVSWDRAVEFCEKSKLRLPTEAEWEYACRAGSVEARYGKLEDICCCLANSDKKPRPVAGQRRPNALGFFDMLGLVWEWCSDWYQVDYYSECRSGVVDPKGPNHGAERVLRGGSFGNLPVRCRASARAKALPVNVVRYHGLRVARDPHFVATPMSPDASAQPSVVAESQSSKTLRRMKSGGSSSGPRKTSAVSPEAEGAPGGVDDAGWAPFIWGLVIVLFYLVLQLIKKCS